jgi:hypothetical protein
MSLRSAVVTGVLASTTNAEVTLESSGFGVPLAAIIVMGLRAAGSSEVGSDRQTIGIFSHNPYGTDKVSCVTYSVLGNATGTAGYRMWRMVSFGQLVNGSFYNINVTATPNGLKFVYTGASITSGELVISALLLNGGIKAISHGESEFGSFAGATSRSIGISDANFLIAISHADSAGNIAVDHAVRSIGFMHKANGVVTSACYSQLHYTLTTQYPKSIIIENCLAAQLSLSAADNISWQANNPDFSGSNVTFNASANSGSDAFIYLALVLEKPEDISLKVHDLATSGSPQTVSGLTHRPDSLLALATSLTSVGAIQPSYSQSIGLTNGLQSCVIDSFSQSSGSNTSSASLRTSQSNLVNLRYSTGVDAAISNSVNRRPGKVEIGLSTLPNIARKQILVSFGNSRVPLFEPPTLTNPQLDILGGGSYRPKVDYSFPG